VRGIWFGSWHSGQASRGRPLIWPILRSQPAGRAQLGDENDSDPIVGRLFAAVRSGIHTNPTQSLKMSRLNPLWSASRVFPSSSPSPSAFVRPHPSLNFSTPFARAPHSSPLASSFSHSFPSRPYSTPHRSRQAHNYARARPFLFLLGVMPVFTFALGTWQLQRLEWKLDLIQQLQDKLHRDPIGLPPKIE